MSADIITEPE